MSNRSIMQLYFWGFWDMDWSFVKNNGLRINKVRFKIIRCNFDSRLDLYVKRS